MPCARFCMVARRGGAARSRGPGRAGWMRSASDRSKVVVEKAERVQGELDRIRAERDIKLTET
jgi:hypothetical protein